MRLLTSARKYAEKAEVALKRRRDSNRGATRKENRKRRGLSPGAFEILAAGFSGTEERLAVLGIMPAITQSVGIFHTHTFRKAVEAARIRARAGVVFLLEQNHSLVNSEAIVNQANEANGCERQP
jgi:hypothetical protein